MAKQNEVQPELPWEDTANDDVNEVGPDSIAAAPVNEQVDDGNEGVGINALTNYQDKPAFAREDILIPRLRLAQGLTQEVQDGLAHPGDWILTGFDPQPEVSIVPLLYTRRRELRDKDDFSVVYCVSEDAVTGVGEPGGECAKCPMNQWTEDTKGKRIPPLCSFSYAYLVYVVEFEALAAVEFKRTGLQAGKTLNTMVAQKGLANFAVKLRATSNTGKKGSYFSPAIRPTQVEPGTLQMARSFMRRS